jgi:nucleoid-associated protein YgaU
MTAVSVRPAVAYRPAAVFRGVGVRPAIAGQGVALAVPSVELAVRPPAGPAPVRPARPTIAVRPAVRAGSRTPVRLTRRGRAVAVGLLLNLAVAAVVAVLALAASATPADRHAATSTVVVGSGDTLWSIAKRVDPQGDPRATIAELRSLNGLSGSTIEVGQELYLPVR